MARRTITKLIDDIDGSEADETMTFAFDGVQYEIDLSAANAEKMRKAFGPYIDAASKVGRGSIFRGPGMIARGAAGRAPVRNDRSNRDRNNTIREWAASKGIKVSDRGRIKQEIVDQFDAEHNGAKTAVVPAQATGRQPAFSG